MKAPADALVVWRCGRCGGVCGYVRNLDGVPHLSTRHRSVFKEDDKRGVVRGTVRALRYL